MEKEMESVMEVLSTNITSPLGMTTQENLSAIYNGYSGLMCHKEGYTASMFTQEQKNNITIPDCTFFESLAITSAREAIERVHIDLHKTVLILSSTKGNIALLEEDKTTLLHDSAKKIAKIIGITNEPIVVCNACISGVAAQILALRLGFEYSIVIGCDVLSRFFISGFQSLKALDPQKCKPFDKNRAGLNLGEAAATIVFQNTESKDSWKLIAGAIRNDANHISGPSRTGEGSYRAIEAISGFGNKASIGVHGTATRYNDSMEAIALQRAGMQDIPVMALKGYYGHTMGAAGVLETIIGMEAMDKGIIPPVAGLTEREDNINVSASSQKCSGPFIKLLSGFGGCNAAIYLSRISSKRNDIGTVETRSIRNVRLTPDGAWLCGKKIETLGKGKELLTELYRMGEEYPKFFKMDILSKLAIAACGLLINDKTEDRAVVLFNSSSSIVSDIRHEKACREGFASPSVFVYTLPNIMTGEIAIKYGYKSETSLYIIDGPDSPYRNKIVNATFEYDKYIKSMVTGWIDASSENDFIAELEILEKL